MQWLKHMTDMVDDPKIRRLVRKHGALGYAVYNLVIERIGKRLSTDSPMPDLEETAEDIADLLGSDTVKVEEVMLTAIHIGLFEQDEITGRILCSKIYKFVQQSETRSKHIREMISAYKGAGHKGAPPVCYIMKGSRLHKIGKAGNIEIRRRELSKESGEELTIIAKKETCDALGLENTLHKKYADKRSHGEWFELDEEDVESIISTYAFVTPVSDRHDRIEENRLEQKRVEKATHPTLHVPINQTRYDNLCAKYGTGTVDDYIQRVIDWGAATGKRTKDYAARASTWIRRDEQEGKLYSARASPTPQDEVQDFSHLRSDYGC